MADLGQRREPDERPAGGRLARLVSPRLDRLRRSLARRGEVEVFPWLEHATAAGVLAGASLGLGLGLAFGAAPATLTLAAFLGTTAGALGGIALAVTWAAAPPAAAAASPAAAEPPSDLWDPWLDRGSDADDPAPEAGPVPEPEAPQEWVAVRPRVRSAETGESVPLEDALGPILANHERGAIRLGGPSGSGKTTALAYLARRVPAHFQVAYLDGPDFLDVAGAAARGRVVFAAPASRGNPKLLADLQLAPWGRDDWIEYLLARDRDRCTSVIARLAKNEPEARLLQGLPELCRVVLDRMAEDESVAGPLEALRVELDRRLPDPEHRGLVADDCLATLLLRRAEASQGAATLRRHDPDEAVFRLIRHRVVQIVLAADRLADELSRGNAGTALIRTLPLDLVREAAVRIAPRPSAVTCLSLVLDDPQQELRQPMAASLLHAMGRGWKPGRPAPWLSGAYLEGADWGGVDLAGADLRHADLRRANLWYARLDRAKLDEAQLAGADLGRASLEEAQFGRADLGAARLVKTQARRADFEAANLVGADLLGAGLDQANFCRCNLSRARLAGSSLVGARLHGATLDGADLRNADLRKAQLKGLNLTSVRLEGAVFTGADLSQCNLEGAVLPDADFSESNLTGALLTGSQLRGASLRGAWLRGAGLAEVDWQGADLRKADLREAAFHLGSSRSGLVGSPTPCEGSRTGFYTDDFNEQDFKSPEEIRKANLCEADLRGATIQGVDFYLVDLRGARVDPEQVPHLRRCGAILEARA